MNGFNISIMKTIARFLPILLMMQVQSYTMYSQEINPLISSDVGGLLIRKTELYDPKTLWDYNESNADLLLEYGFQSLLVQEFQSPERTTRLEVYKMATPDAAYGIYSVSVIHCSPRDSLTQFDCMGSSKYQAAYGNLYIVVSTLSETNPDPAFYSKVALSVMKKNPQNLLELPEPFDQPNVKKSRNNLAFMQGLAGMQNSRYPLRELFVGIHFRIYITLIDHPEFDIYFARISFPDPQQLFFFLDKAGLTQNNMPVQNTNTNLGIYREFQQIDERTIYFLQSQKPYPIYAIVNPRR
jgi:hypothetical protein